MKRILLLIVIVGCVFLGETKGQDKDLLPAFHGIHLMKGDVAKEVIIDDVRFTEGGSKDVDIIRFDNAGAASGNVLPFIVSSKEPMQVDELGLIPLKLHPDSLKKLFKIVIDCDAKIRKRPAIQYGLIRVTYRYNGKLDQYYITDLKSSTKLFRQIERQIINLNDKGALNKFYIFLTPSTLIEKAPTGIAWRY